MELMKHQLEAIRKLDSGKILWGGVGSGKSATVLGHYVEKESPRDLVVITTAKKRDSLDWLREAAEFGIGSDRDATLHGTITVDSWNNIGNYVDREDCFFVFDEQRLVGTGAWVKNFIKIARKNRWILLSATPGDTWLDYAPVFIANGFYRNITDFKLQHVLYEPFVKYPKIRGYLKTQKLEVLRNDILVEMPFIRHTTRYLNFIDVGYDQKLFDRVYKDRWHIYEERPLKDVAEMFRVLRRVVNTDTSRYDTIVELLKTHPRLIIFYNFDYELEILRDLQEVVDTYEWNGHVKDPLPTSDRWVYLVQYISGSEAWNCTTTDATVFYSLTYSYKNFEQSQGRIDRLDTPYSSLYYYVLVSNSVIDKAIQRALGMKKNFNEKRFVENLIGIDPFQPPPKDCYEEKCEI